MKKSKARQLSLWLLCLVVSACIDPYPPPASSGEVGFLVVDGFLNSGTGLASVKITRALPLAATIDYPLEQSAVVRVERKDGTTFFLPEVSPGQYESVRTDLEIGSGYRLLLRTRDGLEFESDFVTLKQSPALEDVSWSQDGNGITVHVDARDPSGSTRYYQWLYTETWEYDADRQSGWIIKNGMGVPRDPSENIFLCYSSQESSKVLVSTTSDQSGDFINDFPLVHIPRGSRKLSRHYSILVQQRALDEQSYTYWQQLQQTTENLGGLFDPLPARVTGNVRSTSNPSEVVLGYFSGGGVEEKRIYISFTDLPVELRHVNRRFCPIDSLEIGNVRNYLDGQGLISPYGLLGIEGFHITYDLCMDCRVDGGVLTKPSYWPY